MTIECRDFKDHDEGGRWRSYDLETYGHTLEELLSNAVYWQTDQDGGSIGDVPADDPAAQEYIEAEYLKRLGIQVLRACGGK